MYTTDGYVWYTFDRATDERTFYRSSFEAYKVFKELDQKNPGRYQLKNAPAGEYTHETEQELIGSKTGNT